MTDVTAGAWDIDEGIRDAERFFALLPSIFPTATLFFAEGTSVARDVQQCYERFADPGPFLPGRDTVWPHSQTFRCSASPAFFQALSALSAQHANPEILDHLSLYERDRLIFHWHDAFANAIQLVAPCRSRQSLRSPSLLAVTMSESECPDYPEGRGRIRQQPNTRLKLTVRVDCRMNLSSARRSLGAPR